MPSRKPYLQVYLQSRQFPSKIIKDVDFGAKLPEKPLFQKILLTQHCRFGAHYHGNPYLQVCLQTRQFPNKIIKDVDFLAKSAEKPLFQKILLTQQFPTKVMKYVGLGQIFIGTPICKCIYKPGNFQLES